MSKIVVQGWDVSPNHAACVELEVAASDFVAYAQAMPVARMRWWAFASKSISSCHRYSHRATYLPDLPKVGKHVKSVDHLIRLSTAFEVWARRLTETKSKGQTAYGAIEDYAVGADQGAHYAGETGGIARVALSRAGVPFQLMPIKGTKKAVTSRGDAEKTCGKVHATSCTCVQAAIARLGFEWPDDIDDQSLEDLHDAASIAYAFVLLLAARARVCLPRHVREVMSSTSKSAPIPLCQRDFLPASI